MNRIRTSIVLLASAALTLLLTAGPALATESGEPTKIQLPATPRDRVGLVLIAALALAGLLALYNARKQLRGERDQASGEFRWR